MICPIINELRDRLHTNRKAIEFQIGDKELAHNPQRSKLGNRILDETYTIVKLI